MSADLAAMFGAEPSKNALPKNATVAYTLACLFIRLGGSFSISSNGHRGVGRPCLCDDDDLPQLPDARPRERFHNADQWEGAIKFVGALLHRLDPEDTDYVFSLFASIAYDERKLTPSIEDPTPFIRVYQGKAA